MRRGLGPFRPLHPRAGRAISRCRRFQIRKCTDVNGLAVLRTSHVANAALVPRCQKLRKSHGDDQRRREKPSRCALAVQQRSAYVRARKHSQPNCGRCIDHEQVKMSRRQVPRALAATRDILVCDDHATWAGDDA
jgi:hypothetical protein